MSGGPACSCPERKKPVRERNWMVTQRHYNTSAFNGYSETPSRYSTVWCLSCRIHWRSKANYVNHTPNAPADWFNDMPTERPRNYFRPHPRNQGATDGQATP